MNGTADYVVELTDPVAISRINNWHQRCVEAEDWLLATECARQSNWAVVPLPGTIVDQQRTEWFLEAIWSLGYDHCYALVRVTADPNRHYRVSVSQGGLGGLDGVSIGLGYCLFPEDLKFAILNDGEEFIIVAGPSSFVQQAIGCSIETARRVYTRYFSDERAWTKKSREKFIGIGRRYQSFNGEESGNEGPKPVDDRDDGQILRPDTADGGSPVREIVHRPHVEKFLSRASDLVEPTGRLSLEWLTRHRWAAVAVLRDIDLMQAEWITDAARSLGCAEAFALTIDPGKFPILLRFPMTNEGILRVQEETLCLSFLLVSEDFGFAILCETRTHYVVAGPRNFVRRAIGTSFKTAWECFLDDDSRYESILHDPTEERTAVYRRYSPFVGE